MKTPAGFRTVVTAGVLAAAAAIGVTGFTADGTFVSDRERHHGGMSFYRER